MVERTKLLELLKSDNPTGRKFVCVDCGSDNEDDLYLDGDGLIRCSKCGEVEK